MPLLGIGLAALAGALVVRELHDDPDTPNEHPPINWPAAIVAASAAVGLFVVTRRR